MSNYPPPQYPPPYQAAPQTSTTAIISLIAGILGITAFPFIGSIVAVITGHMAKGEITRSGGALGGSGLATAGLVLGYFGVVVGILGICVFGSLFAFGLCTPLLLLLGAPSQHSMLLPWLLAA